VSAIIRTGRDRATIDGYEWASENLALQGLLNAMLDPIGPSGSDPNPDYHAALAAVEALGGEVISYDKTEYEEGVIY
jgi:hypothetical protein